MAWGHSPDSISQTALALLLMLPWLPVVLKTKSSLLNLAYKAFKSLVHASLLGSSYTSFLPSPYLATTQAQLFFFLKDSLYLLILISSNRLFSLPGIIFLLNLHLINSSLALRFQLKHHFLKMTFTSLQNQPSFPPTFPFLTLIIHNFLFQGFCSISLRKRLCLVYQGEFVTSYFP